MRALLRLLPLQLPVLARSPSSPLRPTLLLLLPNLQCSPSSSRAHIVPSTSSAASPAARAMDRLMQQAARAAAWTVSLATREGAVKTAAVVVGGAIGAYFLWPTAAVPAAVAATMKAPGAAGFLISRAAFVANPQLYFQILRTAGAAAAAAAFAV